jgi:5-methylcytosine-specific restriction endonuclease McrA
MGVVMEERRCEVEGCNNLGQHNGFRNGKIYRSKKCQRHKRLHYGMSLKTGKKWKKWYFGKEFKKKHNNTCMLCGWIGPCDVHRKVPESQGGRYTDENSILICPNCHRLQHPEVFPMY